MPKMAATISVPEMKNNNQERSLTTLPEAELQGIQGNSFTSLVSEITQKRESLSAKKKRQRDEEVVDQKCEAMKKDLLQMQSRILEVRNADFEELKKRQNESLQGIIEYASRVNEFKTYVNMRQKESEKLFNGFTNQYNELTSVLNDILNHYNNDEIENEAEEIKLQIQGKIEQLQHLLQNM